MVELKETIDTQTGKMIIRRRGGVVTMLFRPKSGGDPAIINVEREAMEEIIIAMLAAWQINY